MKSFFIVTLICLLGILGKAAPLKRIGSTRKGRAHPWSNIAFDQNVSEKPLSSRDPAKIDDKEIIISEKVKTPIFEHGKYRFELSVKKVLKKIGTVSSVLVSHSRPKELSKKSVRVKNNNKKIRVGDLAPKYLGRNRGITLNKRFRLSPTRYHSLKDARNEVKKLKPQVSRVIPKGFHSNLSKISVDKKVLPVSMKSADISGKKKTIPSVNSGNTAKMYIHRRSNALKRTVRTESNADLSLKDVHYEYTSTFPASCSCLIARGMNAGTCWYFTDYSKTTCKKRNCKQNYVCVVGKVTNLTCMRKEITQRVVTNGDGTCRNEKHKSFQYIPYS